MKTPPFASIREETNHVELTTPSRHTDLHVLLAGAVWVMGIAVLMSLPMVLTLRIQPGLWFPMRLDLDSTMPLLVSMIFGMALAGGFVWSTWERFPHMRADALRVDANGVIHRRGGVFLAHIAMSSLTQVVRGWGRVELHGLAGLRHGGPLAGRAHGCPVVFHVDVLLNSDWLFRFALHSGWLSPDDEGML